MPLLPRPVLAALAALALFQSSRATEPPSPLTLFYTSPAAKWTEALPLGNGRSNGGNYCKGDRQEPGHGGGGDVLHMISLLECPFSRVDQTSRQPAIMSAFDPKMG